MSGEGTLKQKCMPTRTRESLYAFACPIAMRDYTLHNTLCDNEHDVNQHVIGPLRHSLFKCLELHLKGVRTDGRMHSLRIMVLLQTLRTVRRA